MRYTYDRPLQPTEVFVHVALEAPHLRRSLLGRLKGQGSRYGFQVDLSGLAPEALAGRAKSCLHSLAILVLDLPFGPGLKPLLQRYLEGFNQVSVALAYGSVAEMLEARGPIEAMKREFGDQVNFLRPDRLETGWFGVSDNKICDNSVCDSVRIKFKPRRDPSPVVLTPAEAQYFCGASRLFAEFKLYHRSASDGYFLLRRPQGFLITATKTYKETLNLRRVSWVHAFDRETNHLYYQGEYLPSSDSVEAAVLLGCLPAVKAVIHTHASDRWTRNPQFEPLVVIPDLPYGEPELGDALAEAIGGSQNDRFLIMREHGEVFWSSKPDGGTELLERIELEGRVSDLTLPKSD